MSRLTHRLSKLEASNGGSECIEPKLIRSNENGAIICIISSAGVFWPEQDEAEDQFFERVSAVPGHLASMDQVTDDTLGEILDGISKVIEMAAAGFFELSEIGRLREQEDARFCDRVNSFLSIERYVP